MLPRSQDGIKVLIILFFDVKKVQFFKDLAGLLLTNCQICFHSLFPAECLDRDEHP